PAGPAPPLRLDRGALRQVDAGGRNALRCARADRSGRFGPQGGVPNPRGSLLLRRHGGFLLGARLVGAAGIAEAPRHRVRQRPRVELALAPGTYATRVDRSRTDEVLAHLRSARVRQPVWRKNPGRHVDERSRSAHYSRPSARPCWRVPRWARETRATALPGQGLGCPTR